MPSSTAVQQFQALVLRAFDTLSSENEKRDERIRELELSLAHAGGVREAEGRLPERLQALELAKVEPVRFRALEDKVTRLDIRSGMIGAAAGTIAGVAIPYILKYLFAR